MYLNNQCYDISQWILFIDKTSNDEVLTLDHFQIINKNRINNIQQQMIELYDIIKDKIYKSYRVRFTYFFIRKWF